MQKVDLLIASLVECKRVEGKPKQRVIAYPGSISESNVGRSEEQLHFYEHVLEVLERVGLNTQERERIYKGLEKKVARPSKQFIADFRYLQEVKSSGWLEYIPNMVQEQRDTHQLANIMREFFKGQKMHVQVSLGGGYVGTYKIEPPWESRAMFEEMMGAVDKMQGVRV